MSFLHKIKIYITEAHGKLSIQQCTVHVECKGKSSWQWLTNLPSSLFIGEIHRKIKPGTFSTYNWVFNQNHSWNKPKKFDIFLQGSNLATIPLLLITTNKEMNYSWLHLFVKAQNIRVSVREKKIKKVAHWLIYHVHSDNCFSFSLLTSSWPWSTTDTWKTHWLMDSVKRILLKMCINITSACNYEEMPTQGGRTYYVLL